mgnify:CR=1 FL=1
MRIGRKEDTASKEGTSENRILGKEISRRFLNIYVKAIEQFNCNNYNYNYKLKQNRLQLKDNGFLGRKRNRKGRIIMNSEFCIAVHGLVFLKLKNNAYLVRRWLKIFARILPEFEK